MRPGYGSTAILPTRTTVDPNDPEANEYYEPGTKYLVMGDLRGRPRRLISLWDGKVPAGWQVGTTHECHHDQAGYSFGLLRVLGWFGRDFEYGEVPTRKLPLSVFK